MKDGLIEMRQVGYSLGFILLIAGAAVSLAQVLFAASGQEHDPLSLGSLWGLIHVRSLVGLQSMIENALFPFVWTPIGWFLRTPAWLILLPIGLVLFFTCRPRTRYYD